MPNTIQVLTFVTNEMLRQTKNNLQFVKNVSGEEFAGRFTESPKKGETIKIRKNVQYTGRDGETYTAESHIERTVDMTVQTTAGVDITLTNRELMFNIDQIAERIVAPAALTLANKIDRAALLLATNATYNSVGTPGTVPTALKTYNQAAAKIAWLGAPEDGHTLLITPDMHVEAVEAGKGLFQPNGQITTQYEKGLVSGDFYGAKVYRCQGLQTNTVGPLGYASTNATVAGASQTGATVNVAGFATSAAARLKKGNIVTFAGCYAVNPWTKQSTGALMQFSLTADVSSAADGTAALPITPSITVTGAYQNVSASPTDTGAVTVVGAANTVSPQGLRFHKDAFVFGSFEQPMPQKAVEFCKQVADPETGLKIRFIRDWDTTNNQQLNRFDVVWAFGSALPEWSCRIQS